MLTSRIVGRARYGAATFGVKKVALAHGIEVGSSHLTLRDAGAGRKIAAVGAGSMVVAAYGLILPQAVLDMPRFGCINITPRSCRAGAVGADPVARPARRRCRVRCLHHADGSRPRYRTGPAAEGSPSALPPACDKLAELGARLIVATESADQDPEASVCATVVVPFVHAQAHFDGQSRSNLEGVRKLDTLTPGRLAAIVVACGGWPPR